MGAFETDAPWVLDRDRITWLPGTDQLRAAARREVPVLTKPSRLPPGRACRHGRRPPRVGDRAVVVAPAARPVRRTGGRSGRHLTPPAHRGRSARTDLHQARPDHLRRARGCSRPSWSPSSRSAATRCRPNRSTAVRRDGRGGPRAPARGRVRVVRRDPARRGVDRPGARRPAADRRGGRGQGPAPGGGAARAHATSRRWRGSRPHLVGRIPVAALANPPALVELFAETIVEELDFRIEAANMLDIATMLHDLGQARLRRAPPAPDARHPAGAGDGAPRRLQLRRRRRHAATPASTPRPWSAPAMVAFMEGAMIARRSSTATCTAATCSCCPTGAPRCSTSASSAGSTQRAAAARSCG